VVEREQREPFMWGYLIHLGYNMWCDREAPELADRPYLCSKSHMRFSRGLWNTLLVKWADAGVNTVVIDLGEGIKYQTHPELAVRGSWQGEWLREELARLRDHGIEPVPKMNFSTAHDAWLGRYGRCVATETYYTVCHNLISEAADLFDGPRLFHLGMDEETAEDQKWYSHVVVRQFESWWHDLGFLVHQVERTGARPWVWSDQVWRTPQVFYQKMPRSVLQSNWYYGDDFDGGSRAVAAYTELDKRGYDQVPTASNWRHADNFEKTVEHCTEHLNANRLKGFLQTVWKPTLGDYRDDLINAVEQVAQARQRYESR